MTNLIINNIEVSYSAKYVKQISAEIYIRVREVRKSVDRSGPCRVGQGRVGRGLAGQGRAGCVSTIQDN